MEVASTAGQLVAFIQQNAPHIQIVEHLDLTALGLISSGFCNAGCESPLPALRGTKSIRVRLWRCVIPMPVPEARVNYKRHAHAPRILGLASSSPSTAGGGDGGHGPRDDHVVGGVVDLVPPDEVYGCPDPAPNVSFALTSLCRAIAGELPRMQCMHTPARRQGPPRQLATACTHAHSACMPSTHACV